MTRLVPTRDARVPALRVRTGPGPGPTANRPRGAHLKFEYPCTASQLVKAVDFSVHSSDNCEFRWIWNHYRIRGIAEILLHFSRMVFGTSESKASVEWAVRMMVRISKAAECMRQSGQRRSRCSELL